MDATAVLTAISQVGFPIAVAAYSLITLNQTVKENTEVMHKLAARLEQRENSLDRR